MNFVLEFGIKGYIDKGVKKIEIFEFILVFSVWGIFWNNFLKDYS